MIHDLHCSVPDVVHPLHAQHLTLRFELLGDTLTLGHLHYQQADLPRCLFIDVGKVYIQPAAGQ